MRYITDHIVAGDPADQLEIIVQDQPSDGGANHVYHVTWPEQVMTVTIEFQKGPIGLHGVNGLTHEALLAIVIDRLQSFQAGQFACTQNAIALSHCAAALLALQDRTRDRLMRKVEGLNEK